MKIFRKSNTKCVLQNYIDLKKTFKIPCNTGRETNDKLIVSDLNTRYDYNSETLWQKVKVLTKKCLKSSQYNTRHGTNT